MKRTPLPARTAPLKAGKPLPRGKALQRAAILRTRSLARSVRPSVRKAKTRVGEFSRKTRKLAYARWDGRCAVDGDWIHPQDLEVQHRRARGMGGSPDPLTVSPANALAVHKRCHERIEASPARSTADGYRVAQGVDPRTHPVRIWDGSYVRLTEDGGYEPVLRAAEPEES